MELWLAEDRWFAAILIILCHLVPAYVVDPAIYAEVRQGIHPWITGLSIIGGVYWTGIPGAIYGPLLLCAVYVILSMYTGVLKDIPLQDATKTFHHGGSIMVTPGVTTTTMQSTPLLKRSESVY